MLVLRLCERFGYIPRPEFSVYKACKKVGEGIWDVLGYYDSMYQVVVICEVEVKRHIKQLTDLLEKSGFKIDELDSYLMLRELTRLHEHVHTLIHIGDFRGLIAPDDEWYDRLPSKVNEPLTVFITWLILQEINDRKFLRAFEDIDAKHPKPYQDWRKLEASLRINNVSLSNIPGIIKIAREKVWSNIDDFINKVNSDWDYVMAVSTAYKFGR